MHEIISQSKKQVIAGKSLGVITENITILQEDKRESNLVYNFSHNCFMNKPWNGNEMEIHN